ncbi:PREDICTED: ATP-dependent DNA helicase PIF1-like [Erythranthe guttata]|uniref:ATP-dependent DNA helicase PIF1-like n=1 Tax=Erythranthe guttata TaxID=4155 RepID=UPI00064D9E1C|nr:PREDICTED: ATP-dependent DNA helicase PIF1-like [Erythranthe guttata]|eukprot:XP_012853805.1 PREDICTED: ATP-dependent DNA helicase PIF1-like [Erythranthe guttata]
MRLHKNMRLLSDASSSNENKIREFVESILRIENGETGDYNDGEGHSRTYEGVIYVNDYLSLLIEEEEKVYPTSDSPCVDEACSEINVEIYSTMFLNTIPCSGLLQRELKLKKGVHVMLIRNIDLAKGLCNGTRLQVERLGMHVISCKVLSGKNVGDMVFIPRMTLIPSNSILPLKFQRRQYPVIILFAMTINISHGQTLSHVGLYLPRPVFSHVQFYVALSRVKSRFGINIFIKGESGELSSVTNNVMYKELFERI